MHRWSQPRWGCCFSLCLPRVARASQPWVWGRNPFGIGRLSKSDLRAITRFVSPLGHPLSQRTLHSLHKFRAQTAVRRTLRFSGRLLDSRLSIRRNAHGGRPLTDRFTASSFPSSWVRRAFVLCHSFWRTIVAGSTHEKANPDQHIKHDFQAALIGER